MYLCMKMDRFKLLRPKIIDIKDDIKKQILKV